MTRYLQFQKNWEPQLDSSVYVTFSDPWLWILRTTHRPDNRKGGRGVSVPTNNHPTLVLSSLMSLFKTAEQRALMWWELHVSYVSMLSPSILSVSNMGYLAWYWWIEPVLGRYLILLITGNSRFFYKKNPKNHEGIGRESHVLKKKLFDSVIYFRETAGVWCHV